MGSSNKRLLKLLATLAMMALAFAAASASASAAAGGWWLVDQTIAPTKPKPGSEAIVYATAVNVGYEPISAASAITISDTLPEGMELLGAKPLEPSPQGLAGQSLPKEGHPKIQLTCTSVAQTTSCPLVNTKEGKGKKEVNNEYILRPGESIRLRMRVKVNAPVGTKLTNTVKVTGGKTGAENVPASEENKRETEVSETPAPYGVEAYKLRPENEDGTLDTQAGSHPFQLSTVFDTTKTLFEEAAAGGSTKVFLYGSPALTKNLHFTLPPGLIGNVANTPKCEGADFNALLKGDANLCKADTAIGFAQVTVLLPGTSTGDYTASVPVFNLNPDPGEPARFGFEIDGVPVVLSTHVKAGSDYGVEVSVHYAPESAAVLNSQVVFWGVPGDPRHDHERGWACFEDKYWVNGLEHEPPCVLQEQEDPQAFLSMPTVCTNEAPTTTVTGESWPIKNESGELVNNPFSYTESFSAPFHGCDALPFEPTIEVHPDQSSASTPTGINVKIKIPQSSTLSPTELAEADIRDTTLTLPAGMMASGGAANNLVSCTAGQLGFTQPGEDLELQLRNNLFTGDPAACPKEAKLGTVRINTPLLEKELTGSVYLARVDTQPFSSPLVLYLTAEEPESGVIVKLAGKIDIDPATGQLTSTFSGAPPLPFSELELHLFDGGRASQSTPDHCGTYQASASFLASSTTAAHPVTVTSSPEFAITSGPNGGPCPGAVLPFSTPVKAGVPDTKGGAFSPFVVTLERPDGNQALKSITVHEPPGAAAMLSSVTPCPTAVAETAQPNCPASSRIGVSTAWAGLGGEPVAIPGEVFLTGPYHGAPFGLLAVTNAENVGPFNLGRIPVLSTINVDPITAAATITSNPLPLFAPKPGQPGTSTGVPSQIKKLVISVDREGFTFNPTNCDPKTIGIESSGYEGGTSSTPVPFQASGCGALPFKPKLSVEVESKFSRTEGLGVRVVVTAAKGDANIKKTKLVFPTSLPSRLTTIQKACDDKIFNVNPANCPEGSVIGTAIAHTPVLKSPLTGPAYLVSHASASFPDAEFVLQGEGIKLVLDGKTDIKKGITSSTFETVPDAPVETFEVKLPHGPHSAFSGFGNLCEKTQSLPTEMVGQNGAFISLTTKAKLVSAIGKSGGNVCN